MEENKLIKAIDNLDEKYINEAEQYRKKVKKLPKAWMGVNLSWVIPVGSSA